MSFHRLPCCLCNRKSRDYSSELQGCLFTDGFRWLYHLSRHCFPERLAPRCSSRSFSAMRVQSLSPCSPTRLRMVWSSWVKMGVPLHSMIAYSLLIIFDTHSKITVHERSALQSTVHSPFHDSLCLTPPCLHTLAVEEDHEELELSPSDEFGDAGC